MLCLGLLHAISGGCSGLIIAGLNYAGLIKYHLASSSQYMEYLSQWGFWIDLYSLHRTYKNSKVSQISTGFICQKIGWIWKANFFQDHSLDSQYFQTELLSHRAIWKVDCQTWFEQNVQYKCKAYTFTRTCLKKILAKFHENLIGDTIGILRGYTKQIFREIWGTLLQPVAALLRWIWLTVWHEAAV